VSKILCVVDSLGGLRRLQALSQALVGLGAMVRTHWFGPLPGSSEFAVSGLRAPDAVHDAMPHRGRTAAEQTAAAAAAVAAERPLISGDLSAFQDALASVAEGVSPSVVHITTQVGQRGDWWESRGRAVFRSTWASDTR
jgi:hypothetical protein